MARKLRPTEQARALELTATGSVDAIADAPGMSRLSIFEQLRQAKPAMSGKGAVTPTDPRRATTRCFTRLERTLAGGQSSDPTSAAGERPARLDLTTTTPALARARPGATTCA